MQLKQQSPGHVPKSEVKQNSALVSAAADQRVTFLACILGAVASIGGFMFGYVRYDDF